MSLRQTHMSTLRKPSKDAKPREPLWSLRECAAKLGCSLETLSSLFAHHAGPAHVFVHGSATGGENHYYRPSEIRAWVRNLPDASRVHLTKLKPRTPSDQAD